jgi:hypothetical protein
MTVWLPIVFSTLSLLTSVISIFQSRAAQQVVQDEILRDRQAFLEIASYVADNPELLSEADQGRLSRAGIGAVSVIKNSWWRTKVFYEENRFFYVFMFLCNKGPGTARDIQLEATFIPREGENSTFLSIPQEQLSKTLYPRDCIALLVDSISSYDRSKGLDRQAEFEWKDVKIKATYKDMIDQEYVIDNSFVSQAGILLTR